MEKSPRNYHLAFALGIGLVGAWLFATVLSGQAFVFLEQIPAGNVGLFLQPTEANILNLELTEDVTEQRFSEAGTYRVITTDNALRARNLTLHARNSGEEIPLAVVSLTKYEPYDTELLQGQVLFSFTIENPGDYEWHVHFLDLSINTPTMTVFPDYTAQNRQRILMIAVALMILTVLGLVWYFKPALSKAQRREKRQKWDDFVSDK